MSEAVPPVRDYPLGYHPEAPVVWPLATDTLDTNGGNAMSWIGSASPVTAGSFVANGYDTKLACDLPAWATPAAAKLSLHARIAYQGPVQDWREVAVAVTTTTVDKPKFELAAVNDPNVTTPIMSLRYLPTATGTPTRLLLNRAGWRFEFRAPETIASGAPKMQTVMWLDQDTLIVTAYHSTTTVMYRVDATTGEYTGRASSTTYQHINSMHLAQDGSVWAQCVVSGFDQRIRLDLASSFSTGAITVDATWNTGDIPTSSIAFATVGGVEYVLLSQHATTGTPRVYVLPRSSMSGPVNQVDRAKMFRVGLRVQDLVQRASDGHVYVSRGGSPGSVEAYDLAAILAGADDASPAPVSTYTHATNLPEGLDFHPITDRLWTCTEGLGSVGDLRSHCAVWSSALAGPEENSYLVDFTGSAIEVRLNGRYMAEAATFFVNAMQKLAIGASPSSTAGLTGFMSGGTVRSVALSPRPFTASELASL